MDSSRKFTDENLHGEELEAFTESFLRAKFDRDRKRRWGKILEEKHGVIPPKDKVIKKKPRTIYLWLGAVAAAVALLFIFYPAFLQQAANPQQQLADNFLQEDFFQNLEISKGDIDVEHLIINAATAYNRKEFKTAIDNYEKVIAIGGGENQHYFFLGMSYLYTQNIPKAIEVLSSLQQDNSSEIFQKEASWFLALAYLKNKEPEKARPLLNKVKSGTWNSQKAEQLLELLE